MDILITDDEQYVREDLENTLERVSPGGIYHHAKNYDEALDVIRNHTIDIAFMDVDMPGKSGLEAAEYIRKHSPETNIIIVTAHPDYALNALRLFVSGYLLKPVMDDDLREALENLRVPVEDEPCDINIRCFGNFDVFYKDKPLTFSRQKGKEFLAYLVCQKGASAGRGEICANLFEDKPEDKANNYFRKVVQTLKEDLEKYGLGDLLIHNKNSYAINTGMVRCDYFDYLSGKSDSEDGYHGEFMNQYSWAEVYIYALENY